MQADVTLWTQPDTPVKTFPLPVEHNSQLCGVRFGEAGGESICIYFQDRASMEGLRAALADFLSAGEAVKRPLVDPLMRGVNKAETATA